MFLMTSILFGAFAALVPIIVHLLHRQRSVPVQWGAMQFLQDTTIRQRRRKNIDHWLLLLMRMVLIAAMAVLLARPLLPTGAYNPFASTTSSDIAIVIDHSLSMGRRSQDRTLGEHAAEVVDRVIDSLHPNDSLSIVLAEHAPRVLTEHPISNSASNARDQLSQVRQSLRQLRPGVTDAAIPAAVQAARELVNKGRNVHKIVLVLTDEQRSNWHTQDDNAWRAALGDRDSGPDRDLVVYTIAIPPGGVVSNSPNLAVADLTIAPALIGTNRTCTIWATVTNTGPGDLPAGAPIQLTIDGKLAARQAVTGLQAGQAASVSFETVFTDPGSHWVKVAAEIVDGLDADNAAYAPIDVINKVPVLVVDGDLAGLEGFRASRFLRMALAPLDEPGGALINTEVVSPTEAGLGKPLSEYAVVILNDVPQLSSDVTAKLADYVQAGHGLWIILGPRSEPGYLNGVLGKTPLFPWNVKAQQLLKGNDYATVETKAKDHPTVAQMVAMQGNPFTGTHIVGWWQLAEAAGTTTVLAVNHQDSSEPLMLTHEVGRSGGRVVVWTTSVDSNWNNFPLVTNFLPLVQETILHLASGLGTARARRLEAGQKLIWTTNPVPTITQVQITAPDGSTSKAQPILTNGKYVLTWPGENAPGPGTSLPGLYAMGFEPATVPQPVYFTVSIDKAELDPSTLSDADVEWFKAHKYWKDRIALNGLDKALGTENRGTELWPYTALLLLAFLAGETALAWRAARLQEGAAIT